MWEWGIILKRKKKKKDVYISESKDACDDSLEFCPEMLAFSSGGGSSVSNSVPAALLPSVFSPPHPSPPPPPHMSSSLSRPPYSWFLSVSLFLCRLFPFSSKMNPVIEQTITFPKSTLRLITSFFSESSGMSKRGGKRFFSTDSVVLLPWFLAPPPPRSFQTSSLMLFLLFSSKTVSP